MAISEADIEGVTEAVWASMLDLGVEPCPPSARGPEAERIVGRIEIGGAWTGSVVVVCASELARTAAAAIFGIAPAEATGLQAREALAEIINMTAGNLKALLPEPCQLGLPAVGAADPALETAPAAAEQTEVGFLCQGLPFLVRIVPGGDA